MNKRGQNQRGYEIGVAYTQEKYKQYQSEWIKTRNCLVKTLLWILLIPIIIFLILI